jgi:hypothetical protein
VRESVGKRWCSWLRSDVVHAPAPWARSGAWVPGSVSVIGIVLACDGVLEDDLVLDFRGAGMDDCSVYDLPS